MLKLQLVDIFTCGERGNGAVRSLAELILKAQGKWDALIFDHYVREKGQ